MDLNPLERLAIKSGMYSFLTHRRIRKIFIVFSHAFFEKEWTNYELKSLYLLDIKALSSEMGWEELVDNILEIVRPDIIDSHLMLKMGVR